MRPETTNYGGCSLSASSLRVNFYEDWDNAQNVAAGLNDVQRFLDKLALLP